MDLGIVFGLAAALCWGVTDIFARGASRTGGTFRTLLFVQIIAAPAMLGLGLYFGLLQLTADTPLWAVLLAVGIGLVILGGAGLLYHAFAIGSISLISPIAASYSAITTLLALTISGEEPTTFQLAGIVVTLLGVILASAVPGNPSADTSKHRRIGPLRLAPGLIEALLSLLIFGGAYWAMRYVVDALGGFTATFVQKVGDLIAMLLLTLIVVLVRRRRKPAKPTATTELTEPSELTESAGPTASTATSELAEPVISTEVAEKPRGGMQRALLFIVFVVPMALLDTAANVAYNLGVAVSLTSIVAVLSSLFSPITVLLAWIFLHERLYRWQWVGVLAIFIGVALVSL